MKRNYYKNAFKKLNKLLDNEILKILLKILDNIENGLETQAKINYAKVEELYKVCYTMNLEKKIYKKYKDYFDKINSNLG